MKATKAYTSTMYISITMIIATSFAVFLIREISEAEVFIESTNQITIYQNAKN